MMIDPFTGSRIGLVLSLAGCITIASCRPAPVLGASSEAAVLPLRSSATPETTLPTEAASPQAMEKTMETAPSSLSVAILPNRSPLIAWHRLEFNVDVSGGAAPYKNPFDPDQVTVDVVASGPAGHSLRVPAFWYEPPQGNERAGWRLRINLPTPGDWKLTAFVHDASGSARSHPQSIHLAAPDVPGLAHRAEGAGKKRYFQTDDGHGFFPVGENLCWSGRRGLADYQDWFAALHQVGANYARLWMSPRPLENKGLGAGKYDAGNAAYFDDILDLAERNGVYCMLAFGTYGDLRTGGYFNEGKWPDHPYNAANGGPVPAGDPSAFFTNADARRLYRQRLRYLIARYGAYRSVAFWEFWNEQGGPRDWFAEMSKYLAENDPYHHLITNSYSTTGQDEVWQIPEIALTQTHRYGDEGSMPDIATDLPRDTHDHDRFEKPHLMGEFGISWRGPDDKFDPNGLGINLHNGLWSSACSGAAGGAAIWWWDNYVAPKNVYYAFAGLARFSKTVDWPNRAFEPITVPVPRRASSGKPTGLGDAVLRPLTEWGAKAPAMLTLTADGTIEGGKLPGYLYGPKKPEFARPITLKVNLKHPAIMTIRVAKVSDKAHLRLSRNGQMTTELAFDASDKGPGGYKSTEFHQEYNIYQAQFDRDVPITLPAGESVIKMENTEGDWLSIDSITIPGIVPSDVAALRTVAIQDGRNGETVLWLQDPESNWRNAYDNKTVTTQAGIRLTVPLPANAPHSFRAEWWDTRQGKIVQTSAVAPSGSAVWLAVPTFTRDIALHLIP